MRDRHKSGPIRVVSLAHVRLHALIYEAHLMFRISGGRSHIRFTQATTHGCTRALPQTLPRTNTRPFAPASHTSKHGQTASFNLHSFMSTLSLTRPVSALPRFG